MAFTVEAALAAAKQNTKVVVEKKAPAKPAAKATAAKPAAKKGAVKAAPAPAPKTRVKTAEQKAALRVTDTAYKARKKAQNKVDSSFWEHPPINSSRQPTSADLAEAKAFKKKIATLQSKVDAQYGTPTPQATLANTNEPHHDYNHFNGTATDNIRSIANSHLELQGITPDVHAKISKFLNSAQSATLDAWKAHRKGDGSGAAALLGVAANHNKDAARTLVRSTNLNQALPSFVHDYGEGSDQSTVQKYVDSIN